MLDGGVMSDEGEDGASASQSAAKGRLQGGLISSQASTSCISVQAGMCQNKSTNHDFAVYMDQAQPENVLGGL